jgi:hypothetical protein
MAAQAAAVPELANQAAAVSLDKEITEGQVVQLQCQAVAVALVQQVLMVVLALSGQMVVMV